MAVPGGLASILALPAGAGSPRLTAPLVLIADNDRAVSSLLGEVLARKGMRVAHAYDGEAAAAMAREPDVAVLVSDLDMPKRHGLEVLASLVDLPTPPPVIVVSGYLDRAIEAQLGRLPFVRAVLRKPFDLFAFADRALALCRQQQEPPDVQPALRNQPPLPEREAEMGGSEH